MMLSIGGWKPFLVSHSVPQILFSYTVITISAIMNLIIVFKPILIEI